MLTQHREFRTSKLYCAVFALLLSLYMASGAFGQASHLKFKHISSEQGLSNSTIECIFQDSRGFIWFGTRDGLNRYDGYDITVYRNNSQDTASISDNYIRCIYEGRDKALWIGTTNGLNRFDPANNTFSRFINRPAAKTSLSNNHITSIYEDKLGRLWIGTYGGGINLFSKKDGSFSHYTYSNKAKSLNDSHVTGLLEDKQGNFWVTTNRGLNLFDRNQRTFKEVLSAEKTIIRAIEEGPGDILWLGTEDQGLLSYRYKSNTCKKYRHQDKNSNSLGSDQVRAIISDKKGNIWLGGVNGGLNFYSKASDSFFHYQNEPGNPSSLSQRTVSALFEDKQGNLWVGTHRGGVNLYSPGSEKFKLVQQEPVKNSLSYNDVKTFYEALNGDLYIGTDGGGLNILNRKNNSFTHYKNDPYNAQSIGSDAVLHITGDSQNNIFAGTWGGGLNLFNPITKTFIRYTNNPANKNSISSDYVQKTFEDSKGNLWVCTYYGGLNLFDRKNKTFRRLIYGKDKITSLLGNNIISIAEDRQGRIWIGTDDGGLNCYNLATESFSHYFHTEIKKPDLRVLFTDSKGRLWLGQAGLYLFNPKQNSFSVFTEKAGLSTEFIKGITEDEKGNLWISASNGLTKFNPHTRAFKKYNTADGLQGLEFEANAYLKTRSGEMFFGGVNGFNSFFPKDIKINKYVPPVYLTDFQIFNKRVIAGEKDSPLKQDISLTKEINLTYKQSAFSFSFAALNYTASENNQYAYKLEGFNKDWTYTGNIRKAFYTNLDPGTYTFRVKAANNDGVWNETGASLVITITPPFWQTWWFITLVLALIFAGAFFALAFKRRLELKELEEKKREEIHQTQLSFFTNISHEFRTPLTLILGPLEKLLKENKDSSARHYYTVMYRNAARLLGLINELMDFRKAESGALKLKVIPGNLSLFIDELAEEFKDAAEEKQVSFEVKQGANFSDVWFDRHVLEKIILNLANNSLKYTAAGGKVSLEVRSSLEDFKPAFSNQLVLKSPYQAKNYIYIRVADNGIGISKESIHHLFERYYRITDSHLGSGVGLAFVKSLTMLHKGTIQVSSERHEGTEIIIALPCFKEDYTAEERWTASSEEGGTRLESISYKSEFSASGIQHPDEKEIASPASAKHILVAEDNDELRTFLKESLSPQYLISEAADGRAGLKKAREESPDLIISDVMMPGMNGIEFCRLIKEDIETSHIPFLMLTAKDTLESEIEGVESGADFYFSKPVSINLLLLTLKNIFTQRQKIKERYSKDHHAEVRELVHTTRDKEFMDKLLRIIEDQLINPELDIDFLCREIGMSRTKLYQKIKSITGQSIGEFVRTIRLKKATEIMINEDVLLTEVMYRVGIQTQSYFTKAFKKEFGKTPTQFLQEIERNKV